MKLLKKSKFLRYYIWNKIARNIRNSEDCKIIKGLKMVGIFPYVIINYLIFWIPIREHKSYPIEYAIVAIIKNEASYIEEWIEYHKKIGIQKFYIYDNESEDNVKAILDCYIKSGVVDYTYWPGRKQQCFAYNDAVEKHKNICKYMAIIDLDEFILPINTGKIDDIGYFMNKYNNGHIGGIAIHWCCFGSSGHISRPDGGVINNYCYRANDDFVNHVAVKTIFNPRKIIAVTNPHFPCYRHMIWSVNENGLKVMGALDRDISYSRFRINHYFCKSKEECKLKFDRGMADVDGKRKWDTFIEYDRNEIYDIEIKKVLEKD